MTIREIPRSFVYTCDVCGAEHLQKGASGHYTESTPDGWSTVRRYGRDINFPLTGRVGRREWLLCPACDERLAPGLPGWGIEVKQ